MKKVLTLLCTSLIVFLLFFGSGNVAFAHEGEGDCGCITEEISGAEKNKIVANLLKSDEFKSARNGLMNIGFKWNGVIEIEVVYNISNELTMVGLPVYYEDDTLWTAVFFNGILMGIAPPDAL